MQKKVNISEKQEDALKMNTITLKTEVGDDKWKKPVPTKNQETPENNHKNLKNSPVVQLQLKHYVEEKNRQLVPTTVNNYLKVDSNTQENLSEW